MLTLNTRLLVWITGLLKFTRRQTILPQDETNTTDRVKESEHSTLQSPGVHGHLVKLEA